MPDIPPIPPAADVDQDILIEGHSYDGIMEYDNPLPGWWKWLFILCILFAIPYTIWYHVMDGNTVYDHYAQDEAAKSARLAAQPKVETNNAALLALLKDPAALEAGKVIFGASCAACHTADGGGLVGPNLCDEQWIHVKTIADIPTVVETGVLEKGMTPWKGILSPQQIAQVSAYVASLRGTTPANPKAAQGEVIPPWGS